MRGAPDPCAGELLALPSDTTERIVPTHDGGQLLVVERGDVDAQPLVLLHGLAMQASTWSYQLRDLADRFRVVAVDQRGHGRSRVGDDGYALTALGDDVASVLVGLDLRETIVVGHSMGGAGLMRFCRDHRDVLASRVAGLVFASNGPGFELSDTAMRAVGSTSAAVLRAVARTRAWGWYRLRDNDLSYALLRPYFGRAPSNTHIEWTRRMAADCAPEAMVRSAFAMADHDGIRALRETDTPALVIVGSHDLMSPPRFARRIADALPNGQLEIIDGAGHQVMLECPTELAKVLVGFADALRARSAEG
jgi:pimeloyl-ACP methyl ester carboxylesterase